MGSSSTHGQIRKEDRGRKIKTYILRHLPGGRERGTEKPRTKPTRVSKNSRKKNPCRAGARAGTNKDQKKKGTAGKDYTKKHTPVPEIKN